MKIDLATLKAATFGDQEKKVEVKRAWLKAVYDMLVEGQRAKEELALLKEQLRARDKFAKDLEDAPQYKEGWDDFHAANEKMFGKGGAFDKIFGRKSK